MWKNCETINTLTLIKTFECQDSSFFDNKQKLHASVLLECKKVGLNFCDTEEQVCKQGMDLVYAFEASRELI